MRKRLLTAAVLTIGSAAVLAAQTPKPIAPPPTAREARQKWEYAQLFYPGVSIGLVEGGGQRTEGKTEAELYASSPVMPLPVWR